jgi:hypothetical protein
MLVKCIIAIPVSYMLSEDAPVNLILDMLEVIGNLGSAF